MVVAAVPFVGGPLQTLIGAVLTPSIDKRRDQWLQEVDLLLRRIQGVLGSLDRLRDDDLFVTAVVEATRIALGTHLEEKIELLRNSLLNLALDPERDDFMAMRLLRFVEELSPEHFVYLEWACDPDAYRLRVPPARPLTPHVRYELFEEDLGLSAQVLRIVYSDLESRGLAQHTMNTNMLDNPHLTEQPPPIAELGRQLLHFVRAI